MLHLALAALIGSVGNRMRGGALAVPGGDLVARLFWGVPAGIVAWSIGQPWWLAPAVGLGAYVGTTAGMFGGLSMGRRGARPRSSPWLTMTAWGFCRVALPVAALWPVYGPAALVVLASGLLCPFIYDLVWRAPKWMYQPWLGYGDGPKAGYDPPQLAEALHGAVMMAALAFTTAGIQP